MRNGKWEDYEINFLKDNYKNMTNKEMAELLDRTKTAIDLKINRLGLVKSKYIYNKNFFKEINTEKKAYWLGFIYADGCISYIKNDHQESYELSIKLQGGDYKHLKKFNKDLGGNVEVTKFKKKLEITNKYYDQCQIRLYSKEIVLDLIKHGVIPNKSNIIKFPFLSEDLTPHFIRGFFDGDGCVSKDSQRNLIKADFTSGSFEFLDSLRTELYKNGISSYHYHEKNNIYRIFIRGMINCDKFLNYIYKDATIYLERKYLKRNNIYKEYDIAQRLLLYAETHSKH